jgi:phage baseplate assembly protein W
MRAISLPFRFDGYGTVATTTSMSRIWADRVRSVIATALGERLHRPNYGTPTPIHLFRSTDAIHTVLDVDIATAFQTWLPQLRYLGLELTEVSNTGEVEVQIKYGVPDSNVSDNSVSIVIEVD